VAELHDAILSLSESTEKKLLDLYARYRSGALSADAFSAAVIAIVGRANAVAYGLADLSLAAAVEAAQGSTTALGLLPPADDEARLALGVATLLAAADEDLTERIARYGRSEPVSAFQDAYVDGLQRRKIPGYVRVLSPGACQLCQWLNKEDYVYPAGQRFHRHEGCTCHPSPTFKEVPA
jgi:hypothetical protein